MRFSALASVLLTAMCALADNAEPQHPPQLQPAAVQISTHERSLGPNPTIVASVETGITGEYVRRGARYLGSGMLSRMAFERQFEGNFAFRGQVAPFYAFQGGGLGETIFDVAVAAGGQRWLAGGTVVGGYTYYARSTNPASRTFMGSNTQEAYAGLEFTLPGQPFVYLRYDFDKGAGRRNDRVGTYVVAGASHRIEINRDIAFAFQGRVGFDFGRGVGGFSDAQFTSLMELRPSRNLALTPTLDWWFPSGSVAPGVHGFRLVPSLGLRYSTSF